MKRGVRRIEDNDVLMKICCDDMNNSIVKSNMLMIDTSFPSLISLLHSWVGERKQGHASMDEVVVFLVDTNPMGLCTEMKKCVYMGIMCRWLGYVAIFSSIEQPWAKDDAPCSRLEIQHGGYYSSVWSIHTSLPWVLLPYCSLETSDADLIIRYRDLSVKGV